MQIYYTVPILHIFRILSGSDIQLGLGPSV